MKVLAYIPLLYGKEYLSEAIKSVHNHVEEILIFYSEKPSFGFSTSSVCPDSKEEMKAQAINTSHKVRWIEVDNIANEGEHTNLFWNYCSGYDLVLRVDSDEVYNEEDLARALKEAHISHQRYFELKGFVNFYRSFDTVCLDGFVPTRIIKPFGIANTHKTLNCGVYHFSLACREELINYKWGSKIHGHASELRSDFLSDKFFGFKKGETTDLHPTSIGLWSPVHFDKTTLPQILKEHPYYNLDIIK